MGPQGVRVPHVLFKAAMQAGAIMMATTRPAASLGAECNISMRNAGYYAMAASTPDGAVAVQGRGAENDARNWGGRDDKAISNVVQDSHGQL
jgi:hypothetical protein